MPPQAEAGHQRHDGRLGHAGGQLFDHLHFVLGADHLPALGPGVGFMGRAAEDRDARRDVAGLDAGAGDPQGHRTVDRLREYDLAAALRRVEQADGGDVEVPGRQPVDQRVEPGRLEFAAGADFGAQGAGDGGGESRQVAVGIAVAERRRLFQHRHAERRHFRPRRAGEQATGQAQAGKEGAPERSHRHGRSLGCSGNPRPEGGGDAKDHSGDRAKAAFYIASAGDRRKT